LTEQHLAHAERLARSGKNRIVTRSLHALRGEWLITCGEWARAAQSLREALRMAHEVGLTDAPSETWLALARFRLGQLPDARQDATRLCEVRRPAHLALAELWHAVGDAVEATRHALAAYRWAWADGEPYVHRYELDRAVALLERLGAEIPELPPYDPAKDPRLPWEDEVAEAIEKLRADTKRADRGS
jgi:hypothetical protein